MIGIIGGTALGQALGALGGTTTSVETPYGAPSAPIAITKVEGIDVALLPRHGVGHTTPPSAVNYRANIWALKKLGVTHVLATTAVGSLREEVHPGELLLPDQLIDRTNRRIGTFFDDVAVHVEFAQPFCESVRTVLKTAASTLTGTTVHPRGTYVVMEGPAFSTRAESDLHRAWGADLIGMTALPEAKLAREAELCYAAISLPTDYDCWRPHDGGREALLQEIRGNMVKATAAAMSLVRAALPSVAKLIGTPCHCQHALDDALFTDPKAISEAARKRHELLFARRLK
ncbi:MAG: S-methyl-5'-thioadenosine phosphorylase [Archangiaceae bacterium]|nr:S-methyl-5'-thioadenosine phosphorylase [Archangiaceae bacterium]